MFFLVLLANGILPSLLNAFTGNDNISSTMVTNGVTSRNHLVGKDKKNNFEFTVVPPSPITRHKMTDKTKGFGRHNTLLVRSFTFYTHTTKDTCFISSYNAFAKKRSIFRTIV